MKVRFRKEINPFEISGKVVFRNVDRRLVLFVRSDAPSMMAGLKKAETKLERITIESSQEERMEAVRCLAEAMFGKDQAQELIDFYREPIAIITACRMYFDKQLKQKIVAAQKK